MTTCCLTCSSGYENTSFFFQHLTLFLNQWQALTPPSLLGSSFVLSLIGAWFDEAPAAQPASGAGLKPFPIRFHSPAKSGRKGKWKGLGSVHSFSREPKRSGGSGDKPAQSSLAACVADPPLDNATFPKCWKRVETLTRLAQQPQSLTSAVCVPSIFPKIA